MVVALLESVLRLRMVVRTETSLCFFVTLSILLGFCLNHLNGVAHTRAIEDRRVIARAYDLGHISRFSTVVSRFPTNICGLSGPSRAEKIDL